jgi:hypothetical protein
MLMRQPALLEIRVLQGVFTEREKPEKVFWKTESVLFPMVFQKI